MKENSFKNILLDLIWQLPQNLIGLIYKKCILNNIITRVDYDADYECYLTRVRGGITLGKYIFVNQKFLDLEGTIKHESGHTKQSKILGPLYLLVIGLPSICWAGLRRIIPSLRKKYSYYDFYTEKWANKLANYDPSTYNLK